MKLNGKTFDRPEPVEIPISNGGEVIVLRAQAVLDYSEFEQLCPPPKPREVVRPGGKRSVDENDPTYRKLVDEHNTKRTHWMMLKSLEATAGLEWDQVDPENPETWKFIEDELTQTFTPFIQNRIMNGVLQANGLDERMLQQARDSFLV